MNDISNYRPIIVSLNTIMNDYDGSLIDFKNKNKAKDFLIYWNVEIKIKSYRKKMFSVCVGVCWTLLEIEDIKNMFKQIIPKDSNFVFAYIPAYDFNKKQFGIFISENKFGETLTNGLVNELIIKSGIEKALNEKF